VVGVRHTLHSGTLGETSITARFIPE